MNKVIIIILLILSILSTLQAGQNRTAVLNKLSYDIYTKKYQALNRIEKQHIDSKLAKMDRIYKRACDQNITKTKLYKELLYKAQRSISMNLYLSRERNKIIVTDNEIETYYKKHLRDYTRVHAYTIVTKTVEDLTPIYKILRTKNKSLITFKDLAKKYSIHPKAEEGGDLGLISYDTMAKPFGKEAFSLKPGKYSTKPFKTILGWHIIYVDSKYVIGLKKIKKEIVYILKMQKYREWFKKL